MIHSFCFMGWASFIGCMGSCIGSPFFTAAIVGVFGTSIVGDVIPFKKFGFASNVFCSVGVGMTGSLGANVVGAWPICKGSTTTGLTSSLLSVTVELFDGFCT